MGCLQSKEIPAAAAPTDPMWQSWGAMHALDGVKAAADSASVPRPASAEGKAAKSKLDVALKALTHEVSSTVKSVEAVCLLMEESDFVKQLGVSGSPTREFDGKWIRLAVPDNGHWITAMEKDSGSVRVMPAFKMSGIMMTLNMAPMRTKVESKGFADMFSERLKAVFKELPKQVQMRTVTEWSMTDPQPCKLDGVEFYEWFQFQTVKTPDGEIKGKQWEIHGMRNRDPAEKRQTHNYGYNISVVAPSEKMFDTVRPVLQQIVQSVRYGDADVAEKMMGPFWDKMGR